MVRFCVYFEIWRIECEGKGKARVILKFLIWEIRRMKLLLSDNWDEESCGRKGAGDGWGKFRVFFERWEFGFVYYIKVDVLSVLVDI